eukprot:scaffold46439_cov46-Prasinocladus_malaysianus.AAC.3
MPSILSIANFASYTTTHGSVSQALSVGMNGRTVFALRLSLSIPTEFEAWSAANVANYHCPGLRPAICCASHSIVITKAWLSYLSEAPFARSTCMHSTPHAS